MPQYRQSIKRAAFSFLYRFLDKPAKAKLLNSICREFGLSLICPYTVSNLPFIPPNDGAVRLLIQDRSYFDQKLIEFICGRLKPGDNCVDIGANVGFWTLPLATRLEELGDSGRVYSFEPTPSTATVLERNLRLNGIGRDRCSLERVALGSVAGTAILTCFDGLYDSCGWNTLGRAPDAITEAGIKKIEVPIVTLDAIWERVGRPRINFLKIDVEGYEPMVLQGARDFFAAHRLETDFIVLAEVNSDALDACGSSVEEFYDSINVSGFSPFRFDFDSNRNLRTKMLSKPEFCSLASDDVLILPNMSELLEK